MIENNPCINKYTAKQTKEWKNKCLREWRKKNQESVNEKAVNYSKKVREEKRFYCELCNLSFTGDKRLNRHKEGYRHKLKESCKEELGENWREQYKPWKVKRYNKTKREKRKKKKNTSS